ncbi:MAG: hypothetical protein WKF30_14615 [Pyrinomonadaceae bacterium]
MRIFARVTTCNSSPTAEASAGDKRRHTDKGEREKPDESSNLERAAKFCCYVLANKIVFSKALRLRFPEMDELTIKKSVKTGAALKKTLDAYFVHAMDAS